MKVELDTKQDNLYKAVLGDTWIIAGDVYIIAWVDGVELVDPIPGYEADDSANSNVLVGLSDGIVWTSPLPLNEIEKLLQSKNATKVNAKVILDTED